MSFLIKFAQRSSTPDECRIPITHGRSALVDPEDFESLNKYRWFLKMSNCCWYAVRKKWVNGQCKIIRMHREIMQTPDDQECHHIYSDTLDNRKAYLQNVYPAEHKELHRTKIFLDR